MTAYVATDCVSGLIFQFQLSTVEAVIVRAVQRTGGSRSLKPLQLRKSKSCVPIYDMQHQRIIVPPSVSDKPLPRRGTFNFLITLA